MRTCSQLVFIPIYFSRRLVKLIQMPISIYLAEAISHSSQYPSKDQSSLILERMPTILCNRSCPITTLPFFFPPFYWAHRVLTMIFSTTIISQKKTFFFRLCSSTFRSHLLSFQNFNVLGESLPPIGSVICGIQ